MAGVNLNLNYAVLKIKQNISNYDVFTILNIKYLDRKI